MSNQGEHLTKDKAKEDGVPARHVNSSVAATGVPTLGAPFSSFVAAHAVPKPFQSLSKPINKPKMQVGQLNVNQGATVVPQALLTPGSLESPGKPLGGGTTLNLSMANPSSSAVGPSAIVQLTTGTPSIPIGSIMRTVGQAPMFSSHVPKGAAAAATTLTNRAGIPVLRPPSINVPSTSAHTNISAHIGVPRQQIINASIRANTPPSTRSPSPALSSQPPEAHRKTIPVHSSTGNLGPGAGIQIARQLGKPVGDSGITKQILSQPTLPKQIHITQTPGLAANKLIVSHCPASSLTSQLPISALSKPVVAAPTVTLPLMNAQTLVASSSAPFPGNPHHSLASTVSTIPVAKVNPVRQQQPSGITPVVSTGPMGAINLATGQDLTNPGLVRDPSGITPRPQAQPINTNLFNSQSQRSALTLGVSTAANPVAAHSDSRPDRAQASVIPLFMQPEFFMQCQSVRPPTAITNLQRPNPVVVAAHGQTPALYQNLIPSSSGLVTSSIDLNVRPSTPTEVTSNMTAGPIPLPAAALALSSSNSSVFNPSSPHPGSLTPQHQGTQQGNTPVSTPNASPRPSILRKRINEGNQPVKKPVCALNTMATERQSPRPDSRTDSAPQSNNSSPKTPATPVGNGNGDGESQSSTDTALSSEATTPTQTSTAELKIKHEPCDSLENGFPSVNSIAASLSGSLPNSNEASPRKKPRKQLLHANEELKDQSTTDDDLDKLDDIKEEMIEDKDEFKTEFIDDEGVRWTVERTKPQILLNCYNISWKPRNNHFNRYTEVKPKDEQRPTVNELCNQRGVMQKASGWKLFHMAAQLEDLTELEKSLNNTVHSLQVSVSPHLGTKHGVIEDEIGALHELAQGNIQRCQLITDQLGEAKTAMFKVLDHKQKIVEIINKHVSKRPIKKKERT